MLLLGLPQDGRQHGASHQPEWQCGNSEEGAEHLNIYQATINGEKSPAESQFCKHCRTLLWVFGPRWPELVHPFADVINNDLPKPPETVDIMLNHAPA